MNNYIKQNSLSVGYNNGGQGFFDTLNLYKDYIHSYYFSFNYMVDQKLISDDDIKRYREIFKKCNTYNIPANVLLNTPEENGKWEYIIEDALSYDINLKGVTVISAETAKKIKRKYPELQVHASVRICEKGIPKKKDIIETFNGCIDVINMSVAFQLNDNNFQSLCKENGIKTKLLLDEICMLGRYHNFSNLPGFNGVKCSEVENGFCKNVCNHVVEKYPWMDICRVKIYKESLKYGFINHDIYKFATRSNKVTNNDIRKKLQYWTNDDATTEIGCINPIKLTNTRYQIFLDYIKSRSECNSKCYECRKCEHFYNELLNN